jgi:hypothetical protein
VPTFEMVTTSSTGLVVPTGVGGKATLAGETPSMGMAAPSMGQSLTAPTMSPVQPGISSPIKAGGRVKRGTSVRSTSVSTAHQGPDPKTARASGVAEGSESRCRRYFFHSERTRSAATTPSMSASSARNSRGVPPVSRSSWPVTRMVTPSAVRMVAAVS